MRRKGYFTPLLTLVCAGTLLGGCSSPMGPIFRVRPGDITRRLDPRYVPPPVQQADSSETQDSLEPEIDFFTGEVRYPAPRLERVAAHVLKEYITHAYEPYEWPYQVWEWGNAIEKRVRSWLHFDFLDFKGRIIIGDDKIGMSFSKEF